VTKHKNKEACISLPYLDESNFEMLDQFNEKFSLAGNNASHEHANELRILEMFLERHVQLNGALSVQCMLLWSEWIRMFRRNVPGFPKMIHEEEFRMVIKDRFHADIAFDGSRGAIYSGIRFVP
jgi:hypothetical protein